MITIYERKPDGKPGKTIGSYKDGKWTAINEFLLELLELSEALVDRSPSAGDPEGQISDFLEERGQWVVEYFDETPDDATF